MVAEPDPVDRAVADQPGGQDPGPGPRVGMGRADEHVVDPPPVAGPPDQPLDLGRGHRVVHRPGMAGPVAGHGPGVVVVRADTAEGLEAAQEADAGRLRGGVEVAGDDRRQRRPVARVQLGHLNGLALTGRLGVQPPGRGRHDQQQLARARRPDRDGQGPLVVLGPSGRPLGQHLHHPVRPAGGDRGPAVAVGARRQVVEHTLLVGGVQPGAGDQLGQLVPAMVRVADLLEGDQVRLQPPQLPVQQAGPARVARVVLHVEGQYPQPHQTPSGRDRRGANCSRRRPYAPG